MMQAGSAAELQPSQPARAITAQRCHPRARCGFAHGVLRRAVVNETADRIVDDQELIDAGAPSIAGAVAGIAARWSKERRRCGKTHVGEQHGLARRRRRRRSTCGAKRAHQPLREHAEEARCKQIRLDTHVRQARHRAGRVVGVQRGENEMAGERRLHGDLCGFEVADLADHDDVWILAQDRTQGARKRGSIFGLTCGLPDAV